MLYIHPIISLFMSLTLSSSTVHLPHSPSPPSPMPMPSRRADFAVGPGTKPEQLACSSLTPAERRLSSRVVLEPGAPAMGATREAGERPEPGRSVRDEPGGMQDRSAR